jgi:hypothetical protein
MNTKERDMTDRDAAPAAAEGADAHLAAIRRRLDAVNEDGYTGTEALLYLINSDIPYLLELAARPAPAAAPRADAHQDAQDGQQTATGAGVASVPTVDAAAVLASHGRDVQFCKECRADWPCDAVLLARRVALLEGLLREVTFPCVFCERIEAPHAPDCRYVAALADGG